jgi:hypothetical protein
MGTGLVLGCISQNKRANSTGLPASMNVAGRYLSVTGLGRRPGVNE